MILGPGHGGVLHNVDDDVADLVDLVHDSVDIDAAGVGQLAVVAVPAGVQQHPVLFVFFWVQHVVTLLTEPDTHKPWTLVSRHRVLFQKIQKFARNN